MRIGGRLGGATLALGCTLILGVAVIVGLVEPGQAAKTTTAPVSCDTQVQQQVVTAPTPSGKQLPGLSSSQSNIARAIVAQGIKDRVPRAGLIIGIMTGMQESTLTNVGYGDQAGPDSRGVFQQRAPWGPLSVRMNPSGAAHLFFTGGLGGQRGLLDVKGWQLMPKTLAAQAVQVSAFPYAYAKWEGLATRVVDAILGGALPAPGPAPAPAPPKDCNIPKPGPVKTACSASPDVSTYPNGRIPLDKLCQIPWQRNLYLRSDADAAFIDLNKTYRAAFGRDICVTDAYRTYDEQVRLKKEKGGLAATPGTSNHGWARAVDLCGGIQADGTPQHLWMLAHAPSTGWNSPPWARPGAGGPYEPWHWEYKT